MRIEDARKSRLEQQQIQQGLIDGGGGGSSPQATDQRLLGTKDSPQRSGRAANVETERPEGSELQPEADPPQQPNASVPEPSPDRVISIGRATLRGVDFRKARFDKFALAGCLFVSCDFRGIRFDVRYQPLLAALPQCTFRDCRFDSADMRRIRPAFARFERCTFDDTAIDGWRTEASEFIGCRFAGALGRVTFCGKPVGPSGRAIPLERKHNEFSENDFRDADLDHVVFTFGIDLSTQRLPLSERYVYLDHFPQRLARASADIGRWDVQEERVAALDMLRELSGKYREQNQIFASRVSSSGHGGRGPSEANVTSCRPQARRNAQRAHCDMSSVMGNCAESSGRLWRGAPSFPTRSLSPLPRRRPHPG